MFQVSSFQQQHAPSMIILFCLYMLCVVLRLRLKGVQILDWSTDQTFSFLDWPELYNLDVTWKNYQ